MRLLRLSSAAAFEAAAGRWLAADKRTNNLILRRRSDRPARRRRSAVGKSGVSSGYTPVMTKCRSGGYLVIFALFAFPLAAEPSVVRVPYSGVLAWLQQKSVPTGERIEITMSNGTVLKGSLQRYSAEGMDVNIKSSSGKTSFPAGTLVEYQNISKFQLRVGDKNRTRAFLGGSLGFVAGALPGAAIALNDYGSSTTEKIGPVVMIVGGIGGAWLGSKLGARKTITVQLAPLGDSK
jgi:hypothetical protein